MSSRFGDEFDKIWPLNNNELKFSEIGMKLLKDCKDTQKPENVDLKEILTNSSNFPIQFPIDSCRISSQPKERLDEIEKQVNSAYPIVYERVIWLYLRFLEHKIQYGSRIEKELYSNMSLLDFVNRLLRNRCAAFYTSRDKFLLISGERGNGGFVEIGTENEKPPHVLKNCLSYDEIKLSALLSVSSYSEFINDGKRKNRGVVEENKQKIERSGIVIGLIGARLSQRNLMEFQDIIVSKNAPMLEKHPDYRAFWNEFYDEPKDRTYSSIRKDGKRFEQMDHKDDIFDNVLMKKRYTISFDTLLLESEARAAKAGKQAYIHVVGIGLGVWCAADQQEEIFLETFAQRIKVLLPKLDHISWVHFSWFQMASHGEIKNGNVFKSKDHPNGGVRVFISNRNPADKLNGPEFENALLIVSYAWDGGSLPGNEFWLRFLQSSGDSSTACSTLVTEIHNPHINKTVVCGENLHVASEKYGVVHISEYVKEKLNN